MTTSTRPIRWAAALIACAVATTSTWATADDTTELERGKSSYDAGRYQEGAERFGAMLASGSATELRDPTMIERARAYYAACLIALDRLDEADRQIEQIIRNNPTFVPDPVIFPGKVIDRFNDIKARLTNEIEAAMRARVEADRVAREKAEAAKRIQRAYLATLEELAGHETVVERHSRWLAALPFGVGQFQNGQDGLGWVFLSTEVILGSISVGSAIANQSLAAQVSPNLGHDSLDWTELQSRLSTTRTINLYSSISLLGVMAAGIIQAEAAFVPEVRETRSRPLPPAPRLVQPTALVEPRGLCLGIAGRF